MEIIQSVIENGRINRPKASNSCKYITIHDTANTAKGANAEAHAKYIKTLNERTSWHYTVDDHSIYQHIPDNEKSYHTSNATANENSIAIELCVNSDGNFEKTVENAVWLVQQLMKKHKIPAANIRAHRDWTGKTCPATLLKSGWNDFLKRCANSLPATSKSITIAELKNLGYTEIHL